MGTAKSLKSVESPLCRASACGPSQVVSDGLSLCQSTGPLDGKARAEESRGRLGAASLLPPAHLHLLVARLRGNGLTFPLQITGGQSSVDKLYGKNLAFKTTPESYWLCLLAPLKTMNHF